MQRNIMIGDKEVPMCANGATPIIFKRVYQVDLIKLMQQTRKEAKTKGKTKEAEDELDDEALRILMEKAPELGYLMSEQAKDGGRPNHIDDDGYLDWLAQFEPFQVEAAATEILALYTESMQTAVDSKKNPDQLSGK